jgi:hypothetical protein
MEWRTAIAKDWRNFPRYKTYFHTYNIPRTTYHRSVAYRVARMRYALSISLEYQLDQLLIEECDGGESEHTEATFKIMRDDINEQIRHIDLLACEHDIKKLENDFERYEYTSSEEIDVEEEDIE